MTERERAVDESRRLLTRRMDLLSQIAAIEKKLRETSKKHGLHYDFEGNVETCKL